MPEKRFTLRPIINFVILLVYFISTWTCVGDCIKYVSSSLVSYTLYPGVPDPVVTALPRDVSPVHGRCLLYSRVIPR